MVFGNFTLRKLVISFLSLLLFAIASRASFAKPIQIETENFILIGDLRESDGKNLLTELEQYRNVILQIMGDKNPMPELIKLRVYTVRGDRDLKLLTGRTDIGGIYNSTIEGPVFILNSKNGFKRGKQARHIALHEFTHHLLASYSRNVYPRWYNEGIANYYSTFQINKKGQIVIGRPYNPYAYALSQSNWMPMEVVTNSITNYPFKPGRKSGNGPTAANYFYAQSWLAVHYLQSTKGEFAKLRKYIKLLNKNGAKDKPFETAFGYSPKEFEKKLKAYYKKNRFSVITITLKDKAKQVGLTVKPLSKDEFEFHKAEAMRFIATKQVSTDQIMEQYQKAEKKLGETADILAAKADLYIRNKDFEKAQTAIKQALEKDPNSAHIQRMAGLVLMKKNEYSDVKNEAELKQAQKYFKQALLQNNNDAPAHFYYAKTEFLRSKQPSKQAIASAKTAISYYRAINFTDSNLVLAFILAKAGDYKTALPIANKALIWSRQPQARMSARSLKSLIQRTNVKKTNGQKK